jgi:hypothetical protein
MVSLTSLWLPIVLSAVAVFLTSFLLHMVLTYHRADYKGVPQEDAFLESARTLNIPPGDYIAPHASAPSAMKDPAFVDKWKRGPIVLMTVLAGETPAMGKQLTQWFVYALIVSWLAGYVASRALDPAATYLEVFRFAGTSAFLAYAMALPQYSIWYRRSWATTFRSMFDGLVYALITGGMFGWLWPR